MAIEELLAQEGWLLYAALFFALVGGAVGLPIPEDLPLIAAGILGERGSAPLINLFLVCYISVVLGDMIIFMIGRKFGAALFSKPWFKRKLSPRRLKKFKLSLEKRSLATIFIARHLFYLRMVTFLACGAVKMPFRQFIFADMLAALISVPLMMCIGYFASENYEHLIRNIEILFLVIGVGLVTYLGYRYFLKSKKTSRDK